jgi:protein-tyrosine-phosphatase
LDQFTLVFVCSGNRFRSPFAEVFLRRLTTGLSVTVESYGTLQLGAAPALPEALTLAPWFGVDLSSHRARLLEVQSLEETDLVLGFEQEHVRRAVVDAGAARRRSFTLPELLSLMEDVDEAEAENSVRRARAVVERAAALRESRVSEPEPGSIPDPFGKSWRVYRETAVEIRELSLRLAEGLFGITGAKGLPALPPKPPRRRFGRRR